MWQSERSGRTDYIILGEMNYKIFTFQLKQYAANKEMADKARSELEDILYEMTGVKGVRFDTIPSSYNPHLAELRKLELIEMREEKENELKYLEASIRSVDMIKQRMPRKLWLMCYDKFAKDMTYKAVGQKYGYSDNGLWHLMKREVEKYL